MRAPRYAHHMGFWANLFGRVDAARAAPPPKSIDERLISASSSGRGPPKRGTRELIASYREQPWLRAVTSRIARGVASARWSVYARADAPLASPSQRLAHRLRHGPDGPFRDVVAAPAWRWGRDVAVFDRQLVDGDMVSRAARRRELAGAGLLREVQEHPLLELLARPNPELTGRSSLSLSQVWFDIKGEAFWLLARGAGGVPTGYWPLPPHWVRQVPTDVDRHFVVSAGGMQLRVTPADMLWLRDPDPEHPYGRGTGVAESLGDELETDEYAAKYLKSWFYNSAMPSILVSFEGASAPSIARAQEKWDAAHRGPANAHRAHFSDGKMNAVRLDASFRDQQIADLRKLSRDFTAQVFNIPPEMIGIIENSNRATINAARYIYVLGVEFPRVEFLRSELQARLAPQYQGNIALEAEVPVPDDEQHRLEVMKTQPTAFDLNEWRGEAGYEALPQFTGVFPSPLPGQQPQLGAGEKKPVEADDEDEQEPVDEASAGDARSDPPWAAALRK